MEYTTHGNTHQQQSSTKRKTKDEGSGEVSVLHHGRLHGLHGVEHGRRLQVDNMGNNEQMCFSARRDLSDAENLHISSAFWTIALTDERHDDSRGANLLPKVDIGKMLVKRRDLCVERGK